MATETLKDIYLDRLKDLYDAEARITDALKKMANRATTEELKEAFSHHLDETRNQTKRLESVFDNLNVRRSRKRCEGIMGILKEAEELTESAKDPDVRDAALVAAARMVEHYEISGYTTAVSCAQVLGDNEGARLLKETLDEELKADGLLGEISLRGGVFAQALH